MLRRLLADAGMCWWKADFNRKTYFLSDSLKKLFGTDGNVLSFEAIIGMIREDYRMRVRARFDAFLFHYKYDETFPMHCPSGKLWIRSKMVYKEADETGNVIVTGFVQEIPDPETSQSEKASSLRMNNLLYQLGSISHTLLSFLRAETSATVIHKVLRDILKQFKGGRTYIIEYDQELQTQTCTYEVVDENVGSEQSRIDHLPVSMNPWWTRQVLSGQSIVLETLDDLPAEAAAEKEFLALQQINSLIVVPMISRKGVWGYIGIDIVEGHHRWSNEDYQWFTSLANIISLCMELQRSEQEARRDKAYLQNLYKHMPLGYVRMRILRDSDGKAVDYLFMDVNYAAEKISERLNRDYIGHRGREMGMSVDKHLPFLLKALDSDDYAEYTYPMGDYNKYYHAILYSIHRDEVICLYSDMTEVFLAHQALDRSEKILRNIYENLPAGIELYDKDGVLVDMNPKDVEIFGLRCKEDALGINVFGNPNIPEEILDKLRNREQVSFRLHYPFKAVDNYYPTQKSGDIEIYTIVSMLYDAQGELIHYLFINIDNTEISRAYSRIAEFESSFSLVSRFGKIGYCKFDLITREGYGVPQWFRNLGEKAGTPLSEVIGVYRYVHPEDRAYIFDCIRRVKLGEIDNYSSDLRIATAEGEKWTRVNVMRNTMNTDPRKLEMICVNYDITELKETERDLIEAKNRAEVSDRLKSAFLANMSHEIRTPLNANVGFSNLLVDAADPEERKEYIGIVQENNELLLKLISDILDLSKIEAGTFDFVNGEVDLNQLCSEILSSLRVKVKDDRVKLLFGEHLPRCRVFCDKSRLTQVISNFINNALKFTVKGSITLGYCQVGPDELKIYVRDTGSGIPKEKQPLVFDRFVKLNSFVQGTGLGLSICRSIVEQMGGRIGLESKEGEGSCFWFTLPWRQGEASPDEGGAPEQESVPGVLPETGERPLVLVAEDTDSNYLLISLILKKEFRVIRAHNGVEAVELCGKIRPALILMDVKMPEMDGIEATRRIRQSDDSVPIIAVTAFAFDRDRQRALEAGCDDYMAKPVQAVQLKEKIRALLAR